MIVGFALSTVLLLSLKCDASHKPDQGSSGAQNTWKLAEDLMKGYNRKVDPGHVTVGFGISLIEADLDLEEQVLRTVVWESITWHDVRLSWKPEAYGGVDVIRIPSSNVWTPDIKLYNEGFEVTKGRDADVNVLVKPTGEVVWMPPSRYSTSIGVPENDAEEIAAYMKFGSWTYDGLYLNLTISPGFEDVDTSSYVENKHFDLVNTTARIQLLFYSCCPEPYQDYMVGLKFKRRNFIL